MNVTFVSPEVFIKIAARWQGAMLAFLDCISTLLHGFETSSNSHRELCERLKDSIVPRILVEPPEPSCSR
jgi:hypothetical protein